MITRKEFTDLINRQIEVLKYEKDCNKLLGIDLYETVPFTNGGWFFDRLMDCIIKEEFRDTFIDYMYPIENIDIEVWDRPEHPLKIYDLNQDEDVVIASIATIDDLYNYIFANNGFRTDYRTSH